MNDYNYQILATWRIEPTEPQVLGEKFLRALDTIAAAAPEIGPWLVSPRNLSRAVVSIDEAREIMPKILKSSVATVDSTPDPDYGYRLYAMNRRDLSPRNIHLSASVGGRFGDRIRFEVGFIGIPSDPDTVTYPLFRAALLAILDQWPSVWANAYAFKMDYYKASTAPGVPPHAYSRFHLPWLGYLSAPLAIGLDPSPETPGERTPDGGLLMIAAEERLDPANPEHMRRSRAIAEIMIARAGDPKGGLAPANTASLPWATWIT
jgi:hypothetical protein